MGQITIRNMDLVLEKEIRRKAIESGKSLNSVLLEMISNQSGAAKGKRKNPHVESLLKLAGGWSKKDADEFFNSIKSCEQIDEDMWK
jgi:hypothetical protein